MPDHAVPKAALATWLITVGAPLAYGVAWVSHGQEGDCRAPGCRACTHINDSVRRALRPLGGLNALTPLEIASSPVSDEPPLANALSSTKIATAERMHRARFGHRDHVRSGRCA